jgi:quinoprotein glucose dehydrogenase
VHEADILDFTPELQRQGAGDRQTTRWGRSITPPVVSTARGPLGTFRSRPQGGTNWPGGSFDPETHIAYLYACNACLGAYGLQQPPPSMSDMRYVVGVAGQPVSMIRGPGEGVGADAPLPPRTPARLPAAAGRRGRLSVDGLPLLKPPYATISAISLDSGDILWQVPAGETPDLVRNHPALKGLSVPRTGQPSYGIGTLVTKSLVIAGDSQVTTTPDHPRGAMLRAYDKQTGKEVGAVWMPAPQSGSPMTYSVNGRQYLIVAISGGNYSGEYVAYALPN